VKLVVSSAVDKDGERLHPRKWNHDFIGLPVVEKEKQHRPSLNAAEIGEIIANTKERDAMLFASLAATGLRIGEAAGVKSTDFSLDCRVLHMRRSIWHGHDQQPKTPNAVRGGGYCGTVIPIIAGIYKRKPGYLFAAATGRPLQQRNAPNVARYRQESRVPYLPALPHGNFAAGTSTRGLN
jgi:integrase